MPYMLDLETLGVSPNSIILTIGCVYFKQNNNSSTFYKRVDIDSCRNYGLQSDSSTLEFWNSQSPEAKKEAFEGKREELKSVLIEFNNWIQSHNLFKHIVWANSPCFDCIILENAYKATGVSYPFKFWNYRDLRTTASICEIQPSKATVQHHSLSDCFAQIKTLELCFQKYKNLKIYND